jgi:hypothetical protein
MKSEKIFGTSCVSSIQQYIHVLKHWGYHKGTQKNNGTRVFEFFFA